MIKIGEKVLFSFKFNDMELKVLHGWRGHYDMQIKRNYVIGFPIFEIKLVHTRRKHCANCANISLHTLSLVRIPAFTLCNRNTSRVY